MADTTTAATVVIDPKLADDLQTKAINTDLAARAYRKAVAAAQAAAKAADAAQAATDAAKKAQDAAAAAQTAAKGAADEALKAIGGGTDGAKS
jgi:hypothetical protein